MKTESVFDNFLDLQKSLNHVHNLAAIWFDHAIQTGTDRTCRIVEGHLLRVEENEVVNVSENKPATHKVVECRGNVNNTILELDLINLKTYEKLILIL